MRKKIIETIFMSKNKIKWKKTHKKKFKKYKKMQEMVSGEIFLEKNNIYIYIYIYIYMPFFSFSFSFFFKLLKNLKKISKIYIFI